MSAPDETAKTQALASAERALRRVLELGVQDMPADAQELLLHRIGQGCRPIFTVELGRVHFVAELLSPAGDERIELFRIEQDPASLN